jgi:hypothetical protein
MAKPDNNTNGA